MGFMKRFRRQKSPKNKDFFPRNDYHSVAAYHGPDCTPRLNDKILRRIFEEVCPHSMDESLDSSEDSGNEGCMTCDMRDLAHCALVKRQWYSVAAGLLYKSIRIDAVHYCELEEVYAAERRRKSRGGDEIDPPTTRLLQLCRTVRDNHYIGQRVRFLKLPYMTRESCKADLARTVSVLPNLEYVDLPDGFYNGDSTCHTLRQELQARCPHIRKMKYNEGAEKSLETLLQGFWQELRVIEINRIQIEPTVLRRVLGQLPWLSEVSFSEVAWLNDSVLQPVPGIPEFPPLDTIKLRKVKNLTAQGLAQYLSHPVSRDTLRTLKIKDCPSLTVPALHIVLQMATNLRTLEFTATVSASLPIEPIPPMTSRSLHTLNYEVISSSSHQMYPPADSYYQYLTTSLMSGSLPALRKLFVRDPSFPESLTLAPPVRPFADSPHHTPRGFNQPLEVFSKGMDELDWIFTSIIPADAYTGRRGSLSGGRPVSSYSAHKGLGPQWGGEARKSVVVPNGFGGFLAVPADDDRPRSAGHLGPSHHRGFSNDSTGGVRASFMSQVGRDKRSSRADLWR
ncbi:F-box domain-containing protein [Aaosphaeria arxii CBS 175.79]|uniref:F-box domain-containing protein n=1 Tax=Aaosphaeria arxii CBS 175.79 TaxID=1450172 RepID=A0A6A5Y6D2_9PLEO|nr:F-box domain-containing protein [Aaosphaeria arxii CBS 175.79]KAF2021122.1 F-box domain-containing protein [Aaosphaeria arxii CBS 175.79]